jgi:N-methylhydantoinase A/oxoprolinase/acetone carboxylase beta subunit
METAVDVATTGLGGDSEVTIDTRNGPVGLLLGPRRIEPVSRLASPNYPAGRPGQPGLVHTTLAANRWPVRPDRVRFVRAATGVDPSAFAPRHRDVFDRLERWRPVEEVVTNNREGVALAALVAEHRVVVAGFTPTDAVLALRGDRDHPDRATACAPGSDAQNLGDELGDGLGDGDIADRAAELLAQCSGSDGNPIAADGPAFARMVVDATARAIAEAILGAALRADGLPADAVASPVVAAALDRGRDDPTATTDRFATSLQLRPRDVIVGLGGPAATHHPAAARLLDAKLVIPRHAEVAGAVGAAIGRVRIVSQATVTQPTRGQYRIHLPDGGPDLGDPDPAITRAADLLTDRVAAEARHAGADPDSVVVTTEVERRMATVENKVVLVEAVVTAVAEGPPKRA